MRKNPRSVDDDDDDDLYDLRRVEVPPTLTTAHHFPILLFAVQACLASDPVPPWLGSCMVYGRVCADPSFRLRSDVLYTVARALVCRLVRRALPAP